MQPTTIVPSSLGAAHSADRPGRDQARHRQSNASHNRMPIPASTCRSALRREAILLHQERENAQIDRYSARPEPIK